MPRVIMVLLKHQVVFGRRRNAAVKGNRDLWAVFFFSFLIGTIEHDQAGVKMWRCKFWLEG